MNNMSARDPIGSRDADKLNPRELTRAMFATFTHGILGERRVGAAREQAFTCMQRPVHRLPTSLRRKRL